MSIITEFQTEIGKRETFITRIETAAAEQQAAQENLIELESQVNPEFEEIQALIKTITDKKAEIKYYDERLIDVIKKIQDMRMSVEYEISRSIYTTVKTPKRAEFKALYEAFIQECTAIETAGKDESDDFISTLPQEILAEVKIDGFQNLYGLEKVRATYHKIF